MKRVIKNILRRIFAKRRLLKRIDFLKGENKRFNEILYMDDTPLVCSRWIEGKMMENNRELILIARRLL